MHPGVQAGEPSHRRAHGQFGGIRARPDAQQSAVERHHLLHFALGVPRHRHQGTRQLDEAQAERGGFDAHAVAVEQACADRFLEGLQAAR
jgi:hypothetical protein